MSDKVPLTLVGKSRLEEELSRMKNQDRPAIIAQISEARSHGDLKENAEYHAAKDKQSFIEGRIQELETIIALAEVIDPKSIESDQIKFSATVTLNDEEGNTKTYQIVGDPEADLKQGRIAITSPIARAMLQKREGDDMVVKSPKGDIFYTIEKVEYK